MVLMPNLSRNPIQLRERLARVKRCELRYGDLASAPILIERCEISRADIPQLIDVVAEDLLDCEPALYFAELQRMPEPDGNEQDWLDGYLLASPTDHWIAPTIAMRALTELAAAEAIPLFVELLFESWRFPRLSINIESEHFFAPLGQIAIAPLVEAFEMSDEEEEDDGRRNIAASLGFIAQKHPALRPEIITHLVTWLSRHDPENIDSNSEIVCVLLDLKATETAEAIHAALEAGCVDEKMCGDWAEIQSVLCRKYV